MGFSASDVVPFTQARAKLSELADQAKAGAEKIITKNGASYVALIDADRLDYTLALAAATSWCLTATICARMSGMSGWVAMVFNA